MGANGNDLAVEMRGVTVAFGSTVALDDLSLTMEPGLVLGLLGPNGSGKTTAVKVLATLTRPDRGSASVFGLDVRDDAAAVRQRIALSGQYAAVDELLSGRQNLVMFGRLFGLTADESATRADELLSTFDLAEAGDRRVGGYSGGMRRRLDLASSLLTDPDLLFLDEPTTGLDLRSRRTIWDVVRSLADRGSSILLTTQYLEEADALADEIAVMDEGRIVAHDAADSLKAQTGGLRLEVVANEPGPVEDALRGLLDAAIETEGTMLRVEIGDEPLATVAQVAEVLATAGISVQRLSLRGPDLDDAFLELTGDKARTDGHDG